jgi:hypothetical protein
MESDLQPLFYTFAGEILESPTSPSMYNAKVAGNAFACVARDAHDVLLKMKESQYYRKVKLKLHHIGIPTDES